MAQYFAIVKRDVPRTPFWRKEYKGQSEQFEFWANKYSLELSEITNLLRIFPPRVIAETIKSNKTWTIKFLKLPDKQAFIYKLYNNTLTHNKKMAEAERKQAKLNLQLQDNHKGGATTSFTKPGNTPVDL